MRIRVDYDLCQGHGVCCAEAPGVFEMEGDQVRVLQEEPPESLRAEVEQAVKYCPTRAIRIEE